MSAADTQSAAADPKSPSHRQEQTAHFAPARLRWSTRAGQRTPTVRTLGQRTRLVDTDSQHAPGGADTRRLRQGHADTAAAVPAGQPAVGPSTTAPMSGRREAWTVRPSMREAPWTAAVPPQDREDCVEDLLDTLKQCVERLDRYRRLGQRVGESNTAATLSGLAVVLYNQGHLDAARTVYQRVLAIHEARLDAGHPDTLRSRQTLEALAARLKGSDSELA